MLERLHGHRLAFVAIVVVPFVSASLAFTCHSNPWTDPGPSSGSRPARTATPTRTNTPTPAQTGTPTNTPSSTAAATNTATVTPTNTPEQTVTSTSTATPTPVTLGFIGVKPWAVLASFQAAAGNGPPTTLTLGASAPADIILIASGGPGSDAYSNALKYGSATILCAASTQNCSVALCPGPYPDTCAETAPSCDGPECTPLTGNLIGPTRSGIDFMMNNTSAGCDSFDEAFTLDADGTYDLTDVCDPAGGGACASALSLCSRRILILPLVDSFGDGASDPLTITAFATFWLDGYVSGQCQGNSCVVQGRFVNASYTGP